METYFYIAYVEVYAEYSNELKIEKIGLFANSYTEAMEKIEKYYGKEIESIKLLEAISNSSVLHLTDMAEEEIREHEYNSFF